MKKIILAAAALCGLLIACAPGDVTRPDERPPIERPDTVSGGLCDSVGCP